MKKTYIEPEISVLHIEESMPIAASGVSSNNGIGFGGIGDGMEADSPFHRGFWGGL